MIQSLAGKSETGNDILDFEVRQLLQHLLAAQAGGQEIQYVADPDSHPPDAR